MITTRTTNTETAIDEAVVAIVMKKIGGDAETMTMTILTMPVANVSVSVSAIVHERLRMEGSW